MNKAEIFINGDLSGIYVKYPNQSDDEFFEAVKIAASSLERDEYRQGTDIVNTEIVFR